ncbi:ATP-binding protein [Pseudomonas sp.]|uniref:ATP-binding protein n=1 Tax=Pseudomonas sp. TaxID=306 RepID=UPI00272B493D|nr:ATP-binding protein [Pseudomonas sp.]
MKLWEYGSIHNRLIGIALAPALMLALAVFAYFILARLEDVDRQLRETGALIAGQLASASEYGAITGNLSTLQGALEATLGIPMVVHAAIFDAEGNQMLELGREEHTPGRPSSETLMFQTDISRQRINLPPDPFLGDRSPMAAMTADPYLGHVEVTVSRRTVTARQREILLRAMLLAMAVIGAALFLAVRLSGALSRPLERMAEAIHALQEGQLDRRLEVTDQHEIGRLMQNINALAQALQDAECEQRRAIEQLTASREDAESANRAKSEFLAMMSHELRTPMNGVMGMLQLLETTRLSSEQVEYVRIAGESTDHLLKVINDILDFSRIENGALELEQIPFNLGQQIQASVAVFELTAAQKGLRLITEVEGEPANAEVIGDPTRLRQILVNLVGNSLKFTEAGEIRIRADWSEEGPDALWLRCEVSDTGIGIPQDRLESMFEAFQQADSTTSRRYGGTGLGLSIARTFARAMGGELEASSELGKGSRFTLTLPLALATPSAGDSIHEGTIEPDQMRPVLLIEDNPVNQMVIEGMLRSLGYQVTTAGSGHEALKLLGDQPNQFAAMLLDLRLPDQDGVAVYEAYRSQCAEHTPIPCIALTASAMEIDRQRCLAAGMQGFLSKPLARQSLQRALQRFIPGQVTNNQSD